MKLYLGADHQGFAFKEQLKSWLTAQNYQLTDLGALRHDPQDDYPQYALKVAQKVSQDPGSRGVLLCASGGGMVITANKVKGIRAVEARNAAEAKHARVHNNANVIALASQWLDLAAAKKVLQVFLQTDFPGEARHVRRLAQISDYEQHH
ncbi:MAG: RpiB/LacA/LacB family sugar-phosphate isomerase [Candidatus Pacebacteria bacterium]|nr:RpiB/LacA/LacB family sugar-phosphate isomerase [Candidatus Paceibacterota bacterium]